MRYSLSAKMAAIYKIGSFYGKLAKSHFHPFDFFFLAMNNISSFQILRESRLNEKIERDKGAIRVQRAQANQA